MMKLEKRKYIFTVEGETEYLYLCWLQSLVNHNPNRNFQIEISVKVQQHPMSYAKTLKGLYNTPVFHICDVEGESLNDIKRFHDVISELKEAKTQKKIPYQLGYSNFSFELWMVLHKTSCMQLLADKTCYLSLINKAYGTKFQSLRDYKQEKNFKSLLNLLNLNDVYKAIKNSKEIMNEKKATNLKEMRAYKGFKYYLSNPAITLHEAVELVLKECL